MVSMKIMGSLILGSYLAIVAFAQDNCVSDYNTSKCYSERAGCCFTDNGNTCDDSVTAYLAYQNKCLKGCTNDTTCTNFLAGTKCDNMTITNNGVGVCRYTCARQQYQLWSWPFLLYSKKNAVPDSGTLLSVYAGWALLWHELS